MSVLDRYRAWTRFDRLPRARLEQVCELWQRRALLAEGQARANRDALAARLEQRADAHMLDAKHAATPVERRLAHEWCAQALREEARDLQEQP